MTIRRLAAAALACCVLTPAGPAQTVGPRREPLDELFGCQPVAEAAARLACYDRQVSALRDAERRRDVLVADQAEPQRTRRSPFGFAPRGSRLSAGADERSGFTRVDAALTAARRIGRGWLFELDDGSRWAQSDAEEFARPPRAGDRIRIRKGALGGFLANVGDAPAVRVRRTD